ncbi:MAG TPA: beta-propeller fold lactonase family protein [Verrucomicrobiales bacterium]|jgi:YVTN family beta-propeller protein|nr:beta-propeller fold lactonase family protein [Verrucomicrobiales bacterium]
MPLKFFSTAVLSLASVLCASAQSYVHFEARHTHPIGLSPDGTRLFVLNSPDARLSVFDVSNAANPAPVLIAEIPVGMEPVSLRARTDDEVWVVNELSDSVSVVSVSGQKTIATLRAPDEPADVVFAQDRAFVSCARSNSVRVFDTVTREGLADLPVGGLYPRALAVNAAGTRVYGAFLLSGNGTTILKEASAPAQPPPTNASLPAPPRTALIVSGDDPRINYTVVNHDIVEINAETLEVSSHTGSAGTNLFDLAVHPITGDVWVANTDALNLIRFEPELRGHFEDNRLTRITMPAGNTTAFDLNTGVDYNILPNVAARNTALAQPSALSFAADGSHLWVAAFGTDRVAKVLTDGTVVTRVDLRPAGNSRSMRGPRGLAWQQNTKRLYVMNKLANSVTVIDTSVGTVIAEVPAGSHDPMPQAIKEGRGFLFDARLSGNGTMSCSSCHLDADRDGLAWDLGDPGGEMVTVQGKDISIGDSTPRDRVMHPMKGPMVTQTLRGLHDGTTPAAPFHWRGDRPTLQSFNATFDKLMGGSELSTADINAMADYINSLRHHPNPNQNLDRKPPEGFSGGNPEVGRSIFSGEKFHCAVCHVLPATTGHNIDLHTPVFSSQPIKDPSLAIVYQKLFYAPLAGNETLSGFGLLHDGTGSSLPSGHDYATTSPGNTQEFANLRGFIMTLDTGTAPAVGHDLTVTTENRADEAVLNEIGILEGQVAAANCDLAVRGILQGRQRAFQLVCTNEVCLYVSDQFAEPGRDRVALLGMLTAGDSLTWLGVPRGQGSRFGGDRDADGIGDADEAPPHPVVTPTGGAVILLWPDVHTDWFAQTGTAPQGPWTTLTQPRTVAGPFFSIQTNPAPGGRSFFRLRRTW